MLSKRLYLMALAVLCVALLGMHSTCCTGSADEPLGGGEEPAAADGGAGTDQGDAGSTGDRRDGGGGTGTRHCPTPSAPRTRPGSAAPPRACRREVRTSRTSARRSASLQGASSPWAGGSPPLTSTATATRT